MPEAPDLENSNRVDAELTWRRLWAATVDAAGGRAQARWLCETASGLEGAEFIAELDTVASHRCVAHLDTMLARLATGEPLQYVLGRWAFRHLDLMVDARVLIPRPETEELVEHALRLLRNSGSLGQHPVVCADLGTGSGAIGLSLAAELPIDGITVWLTDESQTALDVARANLAGIGRGAANVRISAGSWFDALPDELRGQLALVVSNPPYVATDDPRVEAVVRDWEPAAALFGGLDGLDHLRIIGRDAPAWLRPGGWLVLEIGADQAAAVAGLLAIAGLQQIEVNSDASGHDRIVVARRPA